MFNFIKKNIFTKISTKNLNFLKNLHYFEISVLQLIGFVKF